MAMTSEQLAALGDLLDAGETLPLRDARAVMAEVDRLRARVLELTALLNDPDRLAQELRAILSDAEDAREVDRLADGGEV